MTTVYNKKGEGFRIPHAIDVKDWLADGYTLEAPIAKGKKGKTEEVILDEEVAQPSEEDKE